MQLNNNLTARTLTGLVYVILIVGGVLFSRYTFILVFFIVNMLALREFCMLGFGDDRFKLQRIKTIIGGSLIYMLFALTVLQYMKLPITVLIALLIYVIIILQPLFDKTIGYKTAFSLTFSLVYISLPLSLLLFAGINNGSYNATLIIVPLVLIWINDSFAYLTGTLIGKHKLIPKLSPLKTWEGFLGGVLFTLLAVMLFVHFSAVNDLWQWLVLAVMVSLTGTAGDIFESALKRKHGVKDSGKLLPGHGGILDRIDSFIFVIPFYFIYLKLIPYAYSF